MIRNWLAEPVMCADLAFASAPIQPGSGESGVARTVFDRWVSAVVS
jgi:hypothetical protein